MYLINFYHLFRLTQQIQRYIEKLQNTLSICFNIELSYTFVRSDDKLCKTRIQLL